MHFTNDLLDNKVTREKLSLIKPSKLNLGFVDVHNIKGIKDFPIYNDKSGLGGSRDPPKVDSLLFSSHPPENYTIKKIHHEKPPLEEIQTLYNFDAGMKVHKLPTTRNEFSGMLNKLYGIPFKTIHIENNAYKMAGLDGITEKQFQKKQWRAEGRGGGDGGDDEDEDPEPTTCCILGSFIISSTSIEPEPPPSPPSPSSPPPSPPCARHCFF